MASRVMHLAVATLLMRERAFRDPAGLLAGALLPDANPPGVNSRLSHFVATRDGKRNYDAGAFRGLYGDRLGEEGLYLGYYLHLLQDIAYRRFLYCDHDLHFRTQEQREALYRDYRILNGYFIEKYGLTCPEGFPAGTEDAAVCRQFGLEPGRLLEDLRRDFAGSPQGEPAFITPELAEEYVRSAWALCREELDALAQGRPLLDCWKLAWDVDRDMGR